MYASQRSVSFFCWLAVSSFLSVKFAISTLHPPPYVLFLSQSPFVIFLIYSTLLKKTSCRSNFKHEKMHKSSATQSLLLERKISAQRMMGPFPFVFLFFDLFVLYLHFFVTSPIYLCF